MALRLGGYYKTSEECLEGVKSSGLNLRDVPVKFMTYELCLIAVKQGGGFIEYVPEYFRTEEICEIALNGEYGADEAREFLNQNIMDTIYDDFQDENIITKDEADDYYLKKERKGKLEKKEPEHIGTRKEIHENKNNEQLGEIKLTNPVEKLETTYYYCKYCGQKYSSVFLLTNAGCFKSPTKKHVLYEGAKKSQYVCKYCGTKSNTIVSLTGSSHCLKSPNKWHEPAL
jgi:hypothetical protein